MSLASISLSPECHIWLFCIGLHSALRFLVAYAFSFYALLCPIVVHKEGLSCSLPVIHMVLTSRLCLVINKCSLIPEVRHRSFPSALYLTRKCRKTWASVLEEQLFPDSARCNRWYKIQYISNVRYVNIIQVVLFKVALFKVTSYTFFTLFEYCVVFSNMSFHLTAFWDFKSREMVVVSQRSANTWDLGNRGSGEKGFNHSGHT
ncbi:unnamed protein product [Oncorhynchus mykiss]|uniref:Uncharacterized protein n=1 Tax=Oncorhynchus mykiss TaxID=8022 RepID=A0A060XR27_ONCMY|nr:unnamed protein product [Oncorhynchus mykiss]